jgi:hypothetical protein
MIIGANGYGLVCLEIQSPLHLDSTCYLRRFLVGRGIADLLAGMYLSDPINLSETRPIVSQNG